MKRNRIKLFNTIYQLLLELSDKELIDIINHLKLELGCGNMKRYDV